MDDNNHDDLRHATNVRAMITSRAADSCAAITGAASRSGRVPAFVPAADSARVTPRVDGGARPQERRGEKAARSVRDGAETGQELDEKVTE